MPPHGITVEDVITGCTRGTGTNQGGGALPILDNAWPQAATAGIKCVPVGVDLAQALGLPGAQPTMRGGERLPSPRQGAALVREIHVWLL
jgi:hypothetical protein